MFNWVKAHDYATLQRENDRLRAAGKRFLGHLEPQYEPPGAPRIFENLDRYDCDPLAVAEFKGALGSHFEPPEEGR